MSEVSKPHSGFVEQVKAAVEGVPPAPWSWDEQFDSLKGGDGSYVLCTRLDFHGKDEDGEDDFTSHLDLLKGEDLIAIAPVLAWEYLGLVEQFEFLRRAADKAVFQLRTSEDEYARLVGNRLSESLASFPAKERQ